MTEERIVRTRETSYVPPRSPEPLIQELYVGTQDWPWRILVLCSLLNRTTRKQVAPIAEIFFSKWPTPEDVVLAENSDIEETIKPLGFAKKRSVSLKQMSLEFLTFAWDDVSEVHGVGKYARDAWAIFVEGRWDEVEPDDHALNDYHEWIKKRVENAESEAAYREQTAKMSAVWAASRDKVSSGSFRAYKKVFGLINALTNQPKPGDLVWVVKPYEDRAIPAEVVSFDDRHVTFFDEDNEYLFGTYSWDKLEQSGYVVKTRQKYQRLKRIKEEETNGE